MADFGFTTKGVSPGDLNGAIVFTKKSSAPAGTATQLNAYVRNHNGTTAKNIKLAIYSHDSVNNLPETKLAETAAISCAASFDGLKSGSISNTTLTSGSVYWLAVIGENGMDIYNENGGEKFEVYSATYPTFPATGSNSPGDYYEGTEFASIYATYTPAASGPANLKTINGLAKASVKTVNGLAIASVKTWNGLA